MLAVRVIMLPFPDEAVDSESDLKFERLFKEILPFVVVKVIVPPFFELPVLEFEYEVDSALK